MIDFITMYYNNCLPELDHEGFVVPCTKTVIGDTQFSLLQMCLLSQGMNGIYSCGPKCAMLCKGLFILEHYLSLQVSVSIYMAPTW